MTELCNVGLTSKAKVKEKGTNVTTGSIIKSIKSLSRKKITSVSPLQLLSLSLP